MARRRPAGRGSTYEEGGRWRAQLVVDGRKHRRWADTQAQAEALLDRMREQTLAGVRPQHLTVGDYLEHYLSEIVRRNRAPSTAAGYASKVRLYILSAIGPRPPRPAHSAARAAHARHDAGPGTEAEQ